MSQPTDFAQREHIAVVQLADLPGRVEPGGGSLDFADLLSALKRHDYKGPVELEHVHSAPGEVGERASLLRLAMLDET